jgi:hypothetical protein
MCYRWTLALGSVVRPIGLARGASRALPHLYMYHDTRSGPVCQHLEGCDFVMSKGVDRTARSWHDTYINRAGQPPATGIPRVRPGSALRDKSRKGRQYAVTVVPVTRRIGQETASGECQSVLNPTLCERSLLPVSTAERREAKGDLDTLGYVACRIYRHGPCESDATQQQEV